MAITLATVAAFFTSGCVNVKQATITESTFNTAGWKSNAGGDDQAIDATNDVKPNTDVGGL